MGAGEVEVYRRRRVLVPISGGRYGLWEARIRGAGQLPYALG